MIERNFKRKRSLCINAAASRTRLSCTILDSNMNIDRSTPRESMEFQPNT